VLVYKAERNVAYSSGGFRGTASFWLSLDPAGIPGRYSDPFQLTDKKYSDACIWVDFTKNDDPSDFRLGAFGDARAWDATNREARSEEFYHRLTKVAEPPFSKAQWTHVVVTWDGVITPLCGRARLYLNGSIEFTGRIWRRSGTSRTPLSDLEWAFCWTGRDLALFNRALAAEEIRLLYGLPGCLGVARVIAPYTNAGADVERILARRRAIRWLACSTTVRSMAMDSVWGNGLAGLRSHGPPSSPWIIGQSAATSAAHFQ
jgi:hypothetical protein